MCTICLPEASKSLSISILFILNLSLFTVVKCMLIPDSQRHRELWPILWVDHKTGVEVGVGDVSPSPYLLIELQAMC